MRNLTSGMTNSGGAVLIGLALMIITAVFTVLIFPPASADSEVQEFVLNRDYCEQVVSEMDVSTTYRPAAILHCVYEIYRDAAEYATEHPVEIRY